MIEKPTLKLKALYEKYRETILYLVFGGLTTLVNIVVYAFFYNLLHIGNIPSNIVAWFVSVLFAYATNRAWVFKSKKRGFGPVAAEMGVFFAGRIFSGGVDMLLMWSTVDVLAWNGTLMKVLVNIVVIALNYAISKLVVFRRKREPEAAPAATPAVPAVLRDEGRRTPAEKVWAFFTDKDARGTCLFLALLAFCLTAAAVTAAAAAAHITPFGLKSFASMDAEIQYLDFYAYLKNVMEGKDSVFYTLGKTLGGTNIAVFSYYLSSPFSLFVVFFPKTELHNFFTLTVILKLSLSSLCCAVFLKKRFAGLDNFLVILLSLCYGMMQYNFAQSSNVMWLDGVYMLPLLLLGVSAAVRGRRIAPLAVAAACTLVFNWYTGCINVVFSAMWLAYEITSVCSRRNGAEIKTALGRYVAGMAIGLCASMALFMPTLMSLLSGGRGSGSWEWFNTIFVGNPLTVLQNAVVGSSSELGSVSLYCGSLPLLGVACLFAKNLTGNKERVINAVFLAVIVLIFYFAPFVMIFGLLKDVSSYWYRYSYAGILGIVCLAARFYELYFRREARVRANVNFIFKGALATSLILLAVDLIGAHDLNYLFVTILLLVVMALLAYIIAATEKTGRRLFAMLAATILVCGELGLNGAVLADRYATSVDYSFGGETYTYASYAENQQRQIDGLRGYDGSLYRVNQTLTRRMGDNRLTANYNEALAFGYNSISGYTSDPDNDQRDFLQKLGYKKNGDNFNVVNTSLLAADSLLGVKYVLSDYPLTGMEKLDSLGTYNYKSVYYNPYYLPMAFTYERSAASLTADVTDPFAYVNELYGLLTGGRTEVYKKIAYTAEMNGNEAVYTLKLPAAAAQAYCNIPVLPETFGDFIEWERFLDGKLYLDGRFLTDYSAWCAPGVVPFETEGKEEATVRFSTNGGTKYIADAQFYYLDLGELGRASAEIRAREAKNFVFAGGRGACSVVGDGSDNLYISVPYGKGWTVTRNGRRIEPELIGGCMIAVPLESGENAIEMTYGVPGLSIGIVISAVTVAGAIAYYTVKKVWKKKENK